MPRLYRNGDRCPCCGTEIHGKSPDFLDAFNRAVALLGWPFPEDPDDQESQDDASTVL